MTKDTVNLVVSSIVTGYAGLGYLHVYRELDDSEKEIMVDFEYDVQPEEKETFDCPRVHAYVEITSIVDSATGRIEYNLDCIDNLSDAQDEILKLINERGQDED